MHLKNYQNFKGCMVNGHSTDSITLRQRIEAMPEDCILFRSDFPEYHAEFVGGTLSELANEGVLTKIAQGIYAKPRKSRFGVVFPTVDKVVQAIATRDNASVLPSRHDSAKYTRAIYADSNELYVPNNRQREDS